jgi:hypothetical protein
MIFTQRYERKVDPDNTIRFDKLVMQLERAHWRNTLAMRALHSAPGNLVLFS